MEVSPVSALLATRFPPRSSSYRAFSIIDAYGGDPGIQFSPVEEELPAKNPVTTSMSDVKKLQGEDQLSSYYNLDVDETYGSSYGSDPERSTMAILNDYDPFRQGAPVHTPISKVVTPVQKVETPGEKIERSRADSGLAGETVKKHVKSLPSRPNEGLVKGKYMPPAPEKQLPLPPTPQESGDGGQGVRSGQALKMALRLEKPMKDSPTSSSISRSMKELPAIKKPLPNSSLHLQRRLTDDEGTPLPPKSISRSQKPPSLQLKTSNGSTAASIISSSSSVSLPSTLTPDSTSLKNTLRSSQQQFHKRSQSQLSKELLPIATHSPHDRPLPLLPQHKQSFVRSTLRETPPSPHNRFANPSPVVTSDDSPALADNEANMKRLRNLVVKRKPIKGEDSAVDKDHGNLPRVTSPASSNDLLRKKENRAMFSSPSLPTFLSDQSLDNRQSATMVSPSKPRPSLREIIQAPVDSAQNDSQESVLKAPSEGPSMESSEEGTVVNNEQSRSNSPPSLLPPPIQVLEESPSKYGLRKKSEKNLRKAVPDRSSGSNFLSPKGNAHELFTNATARLQAHFALFHSTPQDPVVSENIVVENEAEWVHTNHISTLNLTRPRPIDTNAPTLSTVQLHCHNDHELWHQSDNSVHPIDCALCYQSPSTSTFWVCAWCALRVCVPCKERVEKARANTKLSKHIDGVRDEAERQLRDYRAQRDIDRAPQQAEVSRPSSPVASIYYDYPGVLQEPPMSASDFRARSPGAVSMRSARSMGTMRPRGRVPGGPPPRGVIPGFGPSGQRRFSDGRNAAQPADYPPIPRMPTTFRDEFDAGSPMRFQPRGRSRPRGPPPARNADPMVDINYGLGGDQGRMPTGITGGGMPMPRVRSGLPPEVAKSLDTVDKTAKRKF